MPHLMGELTPDLWELPPDLGDLAPDLGELTPDLGEPVPHISESIERLGKRPRQGPLHAVIYDVCAQGKWITSAEFA